MNITKRLHDIVKCINESRSENGLENSLNQEYVKRLASSPKKFFFCQSVVDRNDDSLLEYVGIIGAEFRRIANENVVKIDAVLATTNGGGSPLMKELLHPKLAFLKNRFTKCSVKFELDSIPGAKAFDQKLGFNEEERMTVQNLVPMCKIVQYE